MKLGDRIIKIRNDKNISQEQLSEMTGISIPTIIKYERNERNPKPEQLNKIAKALNTSPYTLKDIEIQNESDIFALLIQMNKTGLISFEAEKNNESTYLPETMKVSVNSLRIKKNLIAYKEMLDEKEDFNYDSAGIAKNELRQRLTEIDENIENEYLKMASNTSLLNKCVKHQSIVQNPKPLNLRKLEGIVVDCSSMELDFIIQSAKFIKKHSKKIKESN